MSVHDIYDYDGYVEEAKTDCHSYRWPEIFLRYSKHMICTYSYIGTSGYDWENKWQTLLLNSRIKAATKTTSSTG